MSEKIRTILLVSLVTVLIWLWAEGESLSSDTLSPSVVFVQDGGELLLETDGQWTGAVSVRLQGSTRALTDARRELGSQIKLKLGQPGVPSQPGEQKVVNLEEAIRQLPEVRKYGLSVQGVTPALTVVRIVRLVAREVPVRVVFPTDISLLGEAVLSTQRVTIRMPEELAGRLPVDTFAIAPVTKSKLENARDDTSQTLSIPVTLPDIQDKKGITISPEEINVTFRLKRSVDSVTVTSVPVWFSLPPTEGKRWDIEVADQFLRDVTFTGPADSIAKIRSREVIPFAEVQLSSDDLENGIEAKEAVFVGLPPGVESGVAVKTVRLKISRRRDSLNERPNDLIAPELGSPPSP